MHIPSGLSSATLISSASRRSLSDLDISLVIRHLEIAHRNALDLEYQSWAGEVSEMGSEGVVALRSQDLRTDILLISVDAGRDFFNRQKTKVLIYTADIYDDLYFAGPVVNNVLHGMVSINNLYRAAHLLVGTTK